MDSHHLEGVLMKYAEALNCPERTEFLQDFFFQLLDCSPVAMVLLDDEDRVLCINRAFSELFQYPLDAVTGKYINDLVANSPDVRSEAERYSRQSIAGETMKFEAVRYSSTGIGIPVSVLAYPVLNRDKKVAVYVLYNDLRERQAYQEQMNMFRQVLENGTDGVCILDHGGIINWVNPEFEAITGWMISELCGKTLTETGIFVRDTVWQLMEESAGHHLQERDISLATRSGEMLPARVTVKASKDLQKRNNTLLFVSDQTQAKLQEDRLLYLSSFDHLTGLMNRATFIGELNDRILLGYPGEEFAVIVFDLNGFRQVNDNVSYEAGDILLCHVADLIARAVRKPDLVARIGADQFVVGLQSSAVYEACQTLADSVFEMARQKVDVGSLKLSIHLRAGCSRFPADGEDAETLIRYAMVALHRAKREFRSGLVTFESSHLNTSHEQFAIRNALRDALSNRELHLMYQPIVDINNGCLLGVEALCRWTHPQLGVVPPDRFIPIAEADNRIVEIGSWVLNEACRQVKAWHRQGCPNLRVSVNVSAPQLEEPGFVETVQRALAENNLPGSCLVLEITESIQMKNVEQCRQKLRQLRDLRVRIAIDDFGTGHSSLAQLSQMVVTTLKVDRFFISNLEKNLGMLRIIVAIAEELGLHTVAEGVETEEQLAVLREMNFNHYQGYLFSKPLPAEELTSQLGALSICKL